MRIQRSFLLQMAAVFQMLNDTQKLINKAESDDKEEPKQKISNILQKIERIQINNNIRSVSLEDLVKLKDQVETILNGEQDALLKRIQEFLKGKMAEPYRILDNLISEITAIKAALSSTPKLNLSLNPHGVKIIHLAFTHGLPVFLNKTPDEKFITHMVKSQLLVAKHLDELQKKRKMPIVAEGYDQDLNSKAYLDLSKNRFSMNGAMQLTFPKGIPLGFDQLNSDQIEALYKYGIEAILFYLGKYTFYKSIHPSISEEIKSKENSCPIEDIISSENSRREDEALDCSLEAATDFYPHEEKEKPVIIIFGGLHNFLPKCEKRGIPHERINAFPENQINPFPFWMGRKLENNKLSLTNPVEYSKSLELD